MLNTSKFSLFSDNVSRLKLFVYKYFYGEAHDGLAIRAIDLITGWSVYPIIDRLSVR